MKKDMTQGSVWETILLFTLPIMAGNFLQQLYNTVDGIVVGNYLGETALSAVGTCSPLTVLFLALALGLGLGAGVAVAQYFGAGQYGEMNRSISTAVIFMSAVGIALTVIGVVTARAILRDVLSVPENILPYAVAYFRIYCAGLFFQFIYNCAAAVMRALGDSKAMFYFLAVAALGNIALDLLFVAVFHWGVEGAAVATVISQAACAAVAFVYMQRKLRDHLEFKYFDRQKCLLIIKLGIPLAIQQGIVSLGIMAMQRLVNSFGQVSIAAFTAGSRIDQFVFVPCFGFQSGLSAFVGQNAGAGRLDRAKQGLRATLVMSVIISVVITALLYVLAPTLARFFGLSSETLTRAVEQIRFLAVFYIMFSVVTAFGGLLQGVGDVVVFTASSAASFLVRTVLAYVVVALGWIGYSACWVTMPVGWLASIVILLVRYRSGSWKEKIIVRGAPPPEEIV